MVLEQVNLMATLIIMVDFTIELRYGADSIMETYTPTAASSQRREAVLQSDEISTRPHLTPSRFESNIHRLEGQWPNFGSICT